VFKVTSIWEYDKKYINKAYFVKQSMKLCNCSDNKIANIISYANQVITALGIKQGPSCIKIKNTEKGPCLVDLRSCIHGGNGTFMSIVNECIGYSQLEVLMNCYVRPDAFDSIPSIPKLLKHGIEIFLVNYKSGVVKDIDGLDEIVNMNSFLRSDFHTQPGNYLLPTIDSYTCPGSVQLVSEGIEIIDNDVERIRQLELQGLFSFI
jgi:L-amino acid ligase